jgi:hypothetical protein
VVPLGLLPYEEENDMMEKADEWASAEVRWAAVASFLLSPFFSLLKTAYSFPFSCSILIRRTRERFWKDLQTSF